MVRTCFSLKSFPALPSIVAKQLARHNAVRIRLLSELYVGTTGLINNVNMIIFMTS